jgi:Spondin_N
VFEGIWSNETHPKDFPFAVWLTHFSDIVGASHDANFSFWGENHIATDGFRSLAEWQVCLCFSFSASSSRNCVARCCAEMF